MSQTIVKTLQKMGMLHEVIIIIIIIIIYCN
jgi:hypothetical protein